MLAVAFDPVPHHIGQGVDAGVTVFLAVCLNLHLVSELVDLDGEFLQTFGNLLENARSLAETVVHRNLCCQQVPLAVAELIEHGFHLVETRIVWIAGNVRQDTNLR